MATRTKIAVSLSPEVLGLLDRHAAGRPRSRVLEEELLRSLRAREWERLAAQTTAAEREEEVAWAEQSLAAADEALSRDELRPGPSRRGRRR